MKFFLHENNIRIINGAIDLTFTPQEFSVLEPNYPALPSGIQTRYWTPERSYISDGESMSPIDHDCSGYVENVANYIAPAIWAHVSLSQTTLCVNADPPDQIDFEVHLKATTDPEDDDLPIDHVWDMRVRNESDIFFDAFRLEFLQGVTAGTYVYQSGLPLGRYYLKESDFDQVTVGGVSYTVRLLTPLIFTLYREL